MIYYLSPRSGYFLFQSSFSLQKCGRFELVCRMYIWRSDRLRISPFAVEKKNFMKQHFNFHNEVGSFAVSF